MRYAFMQVPRNCATSNPPSTSSVGLTYSDKIPSSGPGGAHKKRKTTLSLSMRRQGEFTSVSPPRPADRGPAILDEDIQVVKLAVRFDNCAAARSIFRAFQ